MPIGNEGGKKKIFAKALNANRVKNYIVQIQSSHAETISTLVKTLGGKVQEISFG